MQPGRQSFSVQINIRRIGRHLEITGFDSNILGKRSTAHTRRVDRLGIKSRPLVRNNNILRITVTDKFIPQLCRILTIYLVSYPRLRRIYRQCFGIPVRIQLGTQAAAGRKCLLLGSIHIAYPDFIGRSRTTFTCLHMHLIFPFADMRPADGRGTVGFFVRIRYPILIQGISRPFHKTVNL
ncbi:unknown [Odoribacter sp. CAG:788]|nr:unknown [Odoribacter sp. CAG:788]